MFENSKFQIPNSKIVFLASFFISAFCILHSALFVHAIAISPLKHTIVVDPGMSQDVAFTVTNDTDQEKTYRMNVDGFVVDAVTSRPVFGQITPATRWVSFVSGDTFTLVPGQRREVVATVRVPNGEAPQTYYVGVFAQEVNQSEGNVGLGARVGTLVFLTVGGVVTEDLQIEYMTPSSFFSFDAPTIDVGLYNAGTVVSPYVGELIITTMSDRVVYRAPLGEGMSRVYAGMKKNDSLSINDLSWRAIGPLSATVVIQYGIEKQMVYGGTTFWFMPPVAWVGVMVLILILVGFFGIMHRRARAV